jgi:hypothetical protein
MHQDQWVTVMSFVWPSESGVPQSKLEAEGFETRLLDAKTVGVDHFVSHAVGGIKLQVKQEDYDGAIKILVDGGFMIHKEAEPTAAQKWVGELIANPTSGKSMTSWVLIAIAIISLAAFLLLLGG